MSLDRHGRVVMVHALYELEELFSHRPAVEHPMSLDDMDRASTSSGTAIIRSNPLSQSLIKIKSLRSYNTKCKAAQRLISPRPSNQQALLAILISTPLALIALGPILNALNKPLHQQDVQTPKTENQPDLPLPAGRTRSDIPEPNNSVLEIGASANVPPIRLPLDSIQ